MVTVGNREVLMRDKPNGFWHGNKPYIVCGAIPNFGQVNGKSIVETLAPVQKMLWFIQNQRLDNLKLLNNLIYLIRSDTDDATTFKWYPGAQWLVDDPDQVQAATHRRHPGADLHGGRGPAEGRPPEH